MFDAKGKLALFLLKNMSHKKRKKIAHIIWVIISILAIISMVGFSLSSLFIGR
jgi:predicted nucleic acid-binding Zn ribbon protein